MSHQVLSDRLADLCNQEAELALALATSPFPAGAADAILMTQFNQCQEAIAMVTQSINDLPPADNQKQ